MPKPPPIDLSHLESWRQWKPEAQARALELLEERNSQPWTPFYCPNLVCNGFPHVNPRETRECAGPTGHEWALTASWVCEKCGVQGDPYDDWLFNHARVDQRPPKWSDDWFVWALNGGRGSGKTRTGAEVTHRVTKITSRITLIAPTGPDLRDTMVEGISGLLATAPPDKRPTWEPSKKKLTWPNGCIAKGFSAEEPDRLRGPQSGFVWADEPAHYPLIDAVWDNMLFGLRVKSKGGFAPKIVTTTTPKPTKWMKELLKAHDTVVRRVSSYANLANLADTYKNKILSRYEGTRTGQQELHGELLEDVEGALWNYGMMLWVEEAPPLLRIVVAVDPAGTANKKSDETGIVVVGIGHDKNLYVLADHTDRYSPERWGSMANGLYEDFAADAIVPERNYGEDMVRFVLENAGHKGARIIPVRSRRGKDIRAEPIVALYEKGRVFHVGERGDLAKLEEELTTWVPGEGDSPNRLDALVHGITELAKHVMPAEISDPNKLLRNRQSPTSRHLRAV